ncbi:MAG: serine hydrolase [Flavobacteriales bacterium CG03_land_8_20_14_0_80_35_15]|nr:serine hydrolase [Zetaproteobacteria bacterium]OIO09929.1 MAG: serine hydrolase [Flavobacteriaceae bacterium CG1_02_35_72]PIV17474.1 MAG: serine hydrolase [Flavobacteriales bacterium CG03_land_8_20_14_0_80_35_15]PIX06797.1 MAG: serine hydrolase [Flavobacteriales bacterium CG_4_8_14_3_um_filter_35_10]PJA04932.1 MAG: serine hydrolase [Flavobacteriales bacterium CG_4_10_14_0_2_um_filter_35_18]
MKSIFKKLALVIVIALAFVVYSYYPKLDIITGYASKSVASAMFLAHRTQGSAETGDNGFSPVNLAHNTVNVEDKSVTSKVFKLKKRTAVYREGLGAVLMIDGVEDDLKYEIPLRNFSNITKPYPYGDLAQKDTLFLELDYKKINKAVADAFDNKGLSVKKTRTVLVLYKDHIIAEKYADGFDVNTPILGWSMTKSITATMFGILQKQGKLSVNQSHLFKDWEQDERSKITLSDLLHMNSGLEWDENYDELSGVTRMLFLDKDMSLSQQKMPAKFKPNTHWNYSSGTTNLLSGYLRTKFATHQDYLDFWYTALLDKIGMHTALIETDLAGNYVGSSYGWASTRDWAKFGTLYLHRGNWNGEQIIDSTWVDYVKTPTNTSNGLYGAQFWLNAGGVYPDVPKDLFSCNGYQGQMVFIIPSKNLVIVRTGLTEDPEFNFNDFLKGILEGVK